MKKFACEQCKRKYTIDEVRVKGKILRIRCRHCGFVMTVQDDAAAAAAHREKDRGALERGLDQALDSPSDSTLIGTVDQVVSPGSNPTPASAGAMGRSGGPDDPEEWHLSVDGVASGPFRLDNLAQRVLIQQGTDRELFVWRDGFDGWLEPEKVPDVAAALQRQRGGGGRPSGPPRPMLPAPPRAPASGDGDPVAGFDAAPTTARPRPAELRADEKTQIQPLPAAAPEGSSGRSDVLDEVIASLQSREAKVRDASRPPKESGASLAALAADVGKQASVETGRPAPAKSTGSTKASDKPADAPRAAGKAGAAPPPFPRDAAPAKDSAPARDQAPSVTEGPSPRPGADPEARSPAVVDREARSAAVIDLFAPSPPSKEPPSKEPPPPRESPPALMGDSLGGSDKDVDFKISDPSQIIDLAKLASFARARPVIEQADDHHLPISSETLSPLHTSPSGDLPVIEHGGQPSSAVMVVSGAAPTDPAKRLRMVLGATVMVCVLLVSLVAYLLMRPPQVVQVQRKDDSRAVTDKPIGVSTEPRVRVDGGAQALSAAEAAKKAAAAKKPKQQPPSGTTPNGKPAGTPPSGVNLVDLWSKDEGRERAAPTLPAQGGGQKGSGMVSGSALQDVVRRNQKALEACYDRVLKHDESLKRARIDVKVKVGSTGIVTQVTIGSPFGGTELGTCFQQTIRRWHFPNSDGDYETEFPIILTAT